MPAAGVDQTIKSKPIHTHTTSSRSFLSSFSNKRIHRYWTLMAALATSSMTLLMSACSTTNISKLHEDTLPETLLEQRYYHVTIPSHDGTKLKATIYQPTLAPGETGALLIHTHGFGVWRMKAPVSLYGSLMVAGKSALQAWRQGYWVISMDQRGFGGSGGKINMADPNVEARDLIAVIDWAVDNLPRLAFDDKAAKDPKVATVGESYGGAVQFFASIQDPRIDAIVPLTTWHDLGDSLAPQNHVKSFWGTLLASTGITSSMLDMGVLFEKPMVQSAKGTLTPEAKEMLRARSMSHFCEQEQYPQADTLLIQGFRDTVFPVNEGWKNKQCIERSGQDVRLVTVQGGHILPTQRWTGLPFYNMEKNFFCEGTSFNTIDVIVDWFDTKLWGDRNSIEQLPELCVTQDYDSGIVINDLHTGGELIDIKPSKVRPGLSGMFEMFLRPMDWLWGIPKPEKPVEQMASIETNGGTLRPTFIPMKVIDQDGLLAGIPTASLDIESSNARATVFAGIGVRRSDTRWFKLVSEQVVPVRGTGRHNIDLHAISARVSEGDIIGLVLYGTSGQYFLNRSWIPSKSLVSGTIGLPLFRRELGEYVAYTPNAFKTDTQIARQQSQPLLPMDNTIASVEKLNKVEELAGVDKPRR